MAGSWDGWCTALTNYFPALTGCVAYCPKSGTIWGRSGTFDCCDNVHVFDHKAQGQNVAPPLIGGVKYMFIRATLDDDPQHIFKAGQDNIITVKGNDNVRFAFLVKGQKPEPVVNPVIDYIRKNLS